MMADFEDETPNTKKTSGVDSKNGSRQEGLYQEYASLKEMSQALVEISSNYYLEEKKINGEKKKRIKCDQKRRIEKRCRLKSKNGSRQEGWVQEDASLKETSQILEEESSNYYLAEKGKMGYYRKKKLDKKGRLDGLVANRLKKIQH